MSDKNKNEKNDKNEVKIEKAPPTQTHLAIVIKTQRQTRGKKGQPSVNKDVFTHHSIVEAGIARAVCKHLNETRPLPKGSYMVLENGQELPVYTSVEQVEEENKTVRTKKAETQKDKLAKKLTQDQKDLLANMPQDELRKLLGVEEPKAEPAADKAA